MKKLLFFLSFIPIITFGQKMNEYKAVNNITYHVGDTVRLGRGSSPDGNFLYLQIGGLNAVLSHGRNQNIDKAHANTSVVIKSIKKGRTTAPERGVEKLWFIVNGGDIVNYTLYIDEAIESCEVVPCKSSPAGTPSVADEILKLKKLLDSGAITKDEYDAQKKKLLNQ